MEYEKGEIVYIKDYPFGKPLNICGEIVGVLSDDHYNVKMMNGCREGKIVKYKYWMLHKK